MFLVKERQARIAHPMGEWDVVAQQIDDHTVLAFLEESGAGNELCVKSCNAIMADKIFAWFPGAQNIIMFPACARPDHNNAYSGHREYTPFVAVLSRDHYDFDLKPISPTLRRSLSDLAHRHHCLAADLLAEPAQAFRMSSSGSLLRAL